MRRTPWLSIAAAHEAAPLLHLATGVAVAFPRSPMVTAQTAWELAEATDGQFRLGLGSQVRAHIERRYGVEFDPPVARMRRLRAGGARPRWRHSVAMPRSTTTGASTA